MLLLKRFYYSVKNFFQMIPAFFRKIGMPSKKFSLIKQYKNIHKGERCFIVAMGPSLTKEDLEKIKNEITFSMNSICLLYEKSDFTFRPTYYGIQDEYVFEKLFDILKNGNYSHPVFYADYLKKKSKNIPNNWIPFFLNNQYHMFDFNYTNKFFSKFSKNAYSVVYDGYSITCSLIQIAIYMGFSKIYLIGCDNNYISGSKNNHFIDHGVIDTKAETAGIRMNTSYIAAKKFSEKHNIQIINVTRGGHLEVFTRKTLEDVLNEQ